MPVEPSGFPRFPLAVPHGKAVRWNAISQDRRSSASWRLWTTPSGVYLTQRNLAGDFKISLHQSGTFQAGFVSSEVSNAWQGLRPSRHLDRWRQPDEFVPGWTRLVSVIHPESELSAFVEPGTEDFLHMPVPAGTALHVLIFRSRATTTPTSLQFERSQYVARLVIKDADDVIDVVAALAKWGPFDQTLIDHRRDQVLSGVVPSLAPPGRIIDPNRASARLLLAGIYETGDRYFIDLAGTRPRNSRTR